MADYIFPAWWYGPDGRGEVFQYLADVPKGWAESPPREYLPPSADEQLSEKAGDLKAAQVQIEALKVELEEAVEVARARIGYEEQVDKLQTANADLHRQVSEAEALAAETRRAHDGEVADLKTALAEAEAEAQIAKFDGDQDGEIGGSVKRGPGRPRKAAEGDPPA